jgi:NAD(P)-dependent dehydrogenase (short-subunit alcohol dehydrogenase family)
VFCLLAAGQSDVYPRFVPTMKWDTATAHAVLAAAGGTVTHPDGTPFGYAKPGLRNGAFIAWGRQPLAPFAPTRASRPVCVVTGASSGIGAAAAVEIARRGCDLALTGRDQERLEGVVTQRRETTPDGYEQMLAVNHLAPYLLTRLLLDRLAESAPSRVVVVASDAHKLGVIDPDDYQSEQGFKPMRVYGRSKLGNVLSAQERARRAEGRGVSVSSGHPGFVSTSLARDRLANFGLKLARPLIRSPDKGARTVVQLATEPLGADGGGRYFADGQPSQVAPWAADAELAARVWEDSARMVGLEP